METVYKKQVLEDSEKEHVPSLIEETTVDLLKDILKEASNGFDDWEGAKLIFEVISEIEKFIKAENIDNIMYLEDWYRNGNIYELHEKIEEFNLTVDAPVT